MKSTIKNHVKYISKRINLDTLKNISIRIPQMSEAYLEPSQTITMEHFCENSERQKSSIIDIRLRSKHASVLTVHFITSGKLGKEIALLVPPIEIDSLPLQLI